MIITIKDKKFDTVMITQLYPAAIVKTGHGDETTEVSLEWIEIESKGRVEIVGYGIFIRIGEDEKYSFIYKKREELDEEISKVSKQLNY